MIKFDEMTIEQPVPIDASSRRSGLQLVPRLRAQKSRFDETVATGVLCATGAGVAALLGGSSSQTAALALAVTQTLGLLLLFRLGYSEQRRWASASCITAAAWAALLLIPAWVYAIDPAQLAFVMDPAPGIALTNLSLFALIAGLVLAKPATPTEPSGQLITISRTELGKRWIIGWTLLGLLSLAAFFAAVGGPIHYLRHLNYSASMTGGLFYLVWGMLALKFLVLALTVRNWANGEPVSRSLIAAWLAVLIVLAATGNRAFIAIALVEAAVAFSLMRRPIRTSRIAAWTIVGGLVLVFGLGTVKRYQTYSSVTRNHESFGSYVVRTAPSEAVQAYVSNYVDTQELVSLARSVVPRYAGYEHGVVLLELLLKPIPHQLRPVVHHQAVINRIFHPSARSSYAIPLQAIAYLEFGVPGVIFAFLLLGAVLARIDHALSAERLSLAAVLTLIAASTMIPFVLRSGIPDGVAVALVEVLGVFGVAQMSASGAAKPT